MLRKVLDNCWESKVAPQLQKIRENVESWEGFTYFAPDEDIGAAREDVTISIFSKTKERELAIFALERDSNRNKKMKFSQGQICR